MGDRIIPRPVPTKNSTRQKSSDTYPCPERDSKQIMTVCELSKTISTLRLEAILTGTKEN
jgi:hypothetical protein